MSGLGHFAPGLLAKTVEPKIPLWVYLVAGETNDLLYFAFTATGLEQSAQTSMSFKDGVTYLTQGWIPWSHGMLMSGVWALLAAGIWYLIWKDRRAALLLGAVTFSHWLMDLLMHDNLPLAFEGSARVGLGLESSGSGLVAITIFDLVFLAVGIAVYLRARGKARA